MKSIMKSTIQSLFIALPLLLAVSCGNIEKAAVKHEQGSASSVTVRLSSGRTAAPSVSDFFTAGIEYWELTLDSGDGDNSRSSDITISEGKDYIVFTGLSYKLGKTYTVTLSASKTPDAGLYTIAQAQSTVKFTEYNQTIPLLLTPVSNDLLDGTVDVSLAEGTTEGTRGPGSYIYNFIGDYSDYVEIVDEENRICRITFENAPSEASETVTKIQSYARLLDTAGNEYRASSVTFVPGERTASDIILSFELSPGLYQVQYYEYGPQSDTPAVLSSDPCALVFADATTPMTIEVIDTTETSDIVRYVSADGTGDGSTIGSAMSFASMRETLLTDTDANGYVFYFLSDLMVSAEDLTDTYNYHYFAFGAGHTVTFELSGHTITLDSDFRALQFIETTNSPTLVFKNGTLQSEYTGSLFNIGSLTTYSFDNMTVTGNVESGEYNALFVTQFGNDANLEIYGGSKVSAQCSDGGVAYLAGLDSGADGALSVTIGEASVEGVIKSDSIYCESDPLSVVTVEPFDTTNYTKRTLVTYQEDNPDTSKFTAVDGWMLSSSGAILPEQDFYWKGSATSSKYPAVTYAGSLSSLLDGSSVSTLGIISTIDTDGQIYLLCNRDVDDAYTYTLYTGDYSIWSEGGFNSNTPATAMCVLPDGSLLVNFASSTGVNTIRKLEYSGEVYSLDDNAVAMIYGDSITAMAACEVDGTTHIALAMPGSTETKNAPVIYITDDSFSIVDDDHGITSEPLSFESFATKNAPCTRYASIQDMWVSDTGTLYALFSDTSKPSEHKSYVLSDISGGLGESGVGYVMNRGAILNLGSIASPSLMTVTGLRTEKSGTVDEAAVAALNNGAGNYYYSDASIQQIWLIASPSTTETQYCSGAIRFTAVMPSKLRFVDYGFYYDFSDTDSTQNYGFNPEQFARTVDYSLSEENLEFGESITETSSPNKYGIDGSGVNISVSSSL